MEVCIISIHAFPYCLILFKKEISTKQIISVCFDCFFNWNESVLLDKDKI